MERTKTRRLTPYPHVEKIKSRSNTDKGGVLFVDRRHSSWFSSIAPSRKTNATTKNAAQLTVRESIVPLTVVITLFFLWGFAGGLGEVLNKQFQKVLHLSKLQSTGLQVAFYGYVNEETIPAPLIRLTQPRAYGLGPLTYAGWVCRRFGYKISFIVGLCFFGVGNLLFWPSGVFRAFGGFCAASFVMGSGLATLYVLTHP